MSAGNNNLDLVQLRRTVRDLSTTSVRAPSLSKELVFAWLKQFSEGPEKVLGLLILRNLVYRTSLQLASSLRQALKEATLSFTDKAFPDATIHWKSALANQVTGISFFAGAMEGTLPGKSGDLIIRMCAQKYSVQRYRPSEITVLQPDERYLLVDDALLTGNQLADYIDQHALFMKGSAQCAVIVALAHEAGITEFKKRHPTVPVFSGELLTQEHGLIKASTQWIDDGLWPYGDVTPLDVYLNLHHQQGYSSSNPLGYGALGLMLAYEHGIPDNSLQLLRDRTEKWAPLKDA